MKFLTDNDPMPWGIHKGVKMTNVPASYLLFCFSQGKFCDLVGIYIKQNMDILEIQAQKERDEYRKNT